MATIKPIEGRSIHQIQSGQVIVDLCSVVKELIENSIDAGATNIEVRFKNQGLESVEVQDNGSGISLQNYETVALKHYTSKLSSYSDLGTLQTFGFRGEALSSLCALSRFTIITCLASDVPKATRLEFEVSGKLKKQSLIAAEKGTTVIVEDLFNNLPVRRRELERNIKREWTRVVALLGQYACIQTSVKLSVKQQSVQARQKASKIVTVFSTKGNSSTRENIANVFGAKTIAALLPLDLELELEPTVELNQRRSTERDNKSHKVNVTGYVSRPAYGEGRQTPDRQMFFVNSRPCGLPQVAKAFNEVYRSYNNSQSPFIFANFEMDTHNYDVNVSPDKRTILLHDQNRMLERLKISLVDLFDAQDHTVPLSQIPTQKLPSYKQLTISRESTKDALSPGGDNASDLETEETRASSIESAMNADNDGEREMSKPAGESTRISRSGLSRDQQAISLISNWASRTTRNRQNEEVLSLASPKPKSEELLKSKFKLAAKSAREGAKQDEQEEAGSEDGSSGDDGTVHTSSGRGTSHPGKPGQDMTAEVRSNVYSAAASRTDDAFVEERIPALPSPARRTDGVTTVQGATPSRIQRPTETTATITIGDHTVTSIIGTPPAKRLRITNVAGDLPSPLSAFGARLSQRFTATGIVGFNEAKEEEESDDEQSPSPLLETAESESPPDRDIVFRYVVPEDSSKDIEMDDSLSDHEDNADEDYIDDTEKKVKEDAKVEAMIRSAEEDSARPSEDTEKRAKLLLKGGSKKKHATVHLIGNLSTSGALIGDEVRRLNQALEKSQHDLADLEINEKVDFVNPEERLSLTINKSDFATMNIIGQFNLGFILASRTSSSHTKMGSGHNSDDLFIIDQHASDEKYNFERLQSTTIVQSQRLVHPKTLDLTALEEEVVKENLNALETNGFVVTIDESGDSPVGQRCQVLSLPLSHETTFSLSDLEELISLLSDHPTDSNLPPPRPSKVRKMFAMRACRSSIMIGRTLTKRQMEKVVSHMGELDKPWNCPHGRPTMRHLCGLSAWDEVGWKEGDKIDAEDEDTLLRTDWLSFVQNMRAAS